MDEGGKNQKLKKKKRERERERECLRDRVREVNSISPGCSASDAVRSHSAPSRSPSRSLHRARLYRVFGWHGRTDSEEE